MGALQARLCGIDHVLIDEAQDTSPRQWQIVERARPASSSSEPARARSTRTVFAVGDEKQSILLVPGRGAARVSTPCGAALRAALPRQSSGSCDILPFRHSFRSGATRAGGGRHRVRATRRRIRGSRRTTWKTAHEALLDDGAGRRRDLGCGQARQPSARSRPGTRHSTDVTETSPQASPGAKTGRATMSAR